MCDMVSVCHLLYGSVKVKCYIPEVRLLPRHHHAFDHWNLLLCFNSSLLIPRFKQQAGWMYYECCIHAIVLPTGWFLTVKWFQFMSLIGVITCCIAVAKWPVALWLLWINYGIHLRRWTDSWCQTSGTPCGQSEQSIHPGYGITTVRCFHNGKSYMWHVKYFM